MVIAVTSSAESSRHCPGARAGSSASPPMASRCSPLTPAPYTPNTPLDLVVHPLPEPDFHGQAVRGQGFHLAGRGGAIRQRHALGKAPAHLLGQRCVNDHRIGLGDMALRGKDLVGEAAVIRQQNKAGAGLVQPAGREQLPPGVASPIRSTTVVSRLSVEALTTPSGLLSIR